MCNLESHECSLVSVIIPAYNVGEYIKVCLDSVLQQTYKNVEIIIVNDGSTDATGSIADEYASLDNRIKVIHKKNGGVASARNDGIKAASGEFIVFVDPDDWISENHIEYLLRLQKIDNADMCISTLLFTKRGETQEKDIYVKTISSEAAAVLLMSPNIYVGSYGKLYRLKWIRDNQLYQNESLFSGEGLHFTVKSAQYANCVTISNMKIYYYRRNVAKSATTKFNINMFINNELSLNIIKSEQLLESKEFDVMWKVFRTNLFINGMIALINNNKRKEYNNEYSYWWKTVKGDRNVLLKSDTVSVKVKIRVIIFLMFPVLWSKLAKIKRKRAFIGSV